MIILQAVGPVAIAMNLSPACKSSLYLQYYFSTDLSPKVLSNSLCEHFLLKSENKHKHIEFDNTWGFRPVKK